MRRISRNCLLLLLVWGLTSCSSDESVDRSHSFRTYREDGVVIAETTGGPKYKGELFRYEKILELKEDTSNDESMFYRPWGIMYRPWGIMEGDDGRYYMNDGGHKRIMVYDPEGNYLFGFGRGGQGPGEFERPLLISAKDDRICIYDGDLYRISWFNMEGVLQETIRLPDVMGRPMSFYLGPDRALIGFRTIRPRGSSFTYEQGFTIAATPEGDTLAYCQTEQVQVGVRTTVDQGGRPLPTGGPIYFSPKARGLYHPAHGIVMTTGEEPELHCYDLTGQLTRIIRIDLEPEPVTQEDRAKILAESDRDIAESEGMARAIHTAVRKVVTFRDHKAYWDWIEVDTEGYLWLKIPEWYYDLEGQGIGARFHVISPEGEYLGTSRQPTMMGDMANGNIYLIESDPETAAETPTIYRIIPAVRGLKYP